MNLFKKLKSRKGLTGADVAGAVTVIVLTVGVVTAIYANAINKSKDNIRYANAVRIATNIMETIQEKPYDYVTGLCDSEGSHTYSGQNVISGSGENIYEVKKVFGTNIPNGFKATVTANPGGTEYDVARDITINVQYKASMTYKTITLTYTKTRENVEICNPPDISLIKGYVTDDNTSTAKNYYYPVKFTTASSLVITTQDDISWYDYSQDLSTIKPAYIWVTNTSDVTVGTTKNLSEIKNELYVWIPRFAFELDGSSSSENITSIEYLYGGTNYVINSNKKGDLYYYGVIYNDISETSTPKTYDYGYKTTHTLPGEYSSLGEIDVFSNYDYTNLVLVPTIIQNSAPVSGMWYCPWGGDDKNARNVVDFKDFVKVMIKGLKIDLPDSPT